MPSVNILIGGTGIKSAALMRRRAAFYRHGVGAVFGIDTDNEPEAADARALGPQQLILSNAQFQQLLQQRAASTVQTAWSRMWTAQSGGAREPFSLTVLRAGAETVRANLLGGEGLYTLRATGWHALFTLEQANPGFVSQIAAAINTAAADLPAGERAVVNIVASIAGGTGSGLFLPLIGKLRREPTLQHDPANYAIHLTLITPSAFETTLQGADNEMVLRSRGRSGSYAAFREVESLCRPSDARVPRFEARPIDGGARPSVERIYWIGRRGVDANAPADAAFNEASRLLELLNDDGVANLINGKVGATPFTQLPSVTLLEYPKLEMARGLAARSAGDLIQEIRDVRGDVSTPILNKRPAERGPIVSFIQEHRLQPFVLQTLAIATTTNVDQGEVVGQGGLIAELGVPARLDRVPTGTAVTPTGYHGTDTEWTTYMGAMHLALETAEKQDILDTERMLAENQTKEAAYVVQAAAETLQETSPPAGQIVQAGQGQLVSLGAARLRLQGLVETLNIARTFFGRGPVASVTATGDPPLRSVQEQREIVERFESRLLGPLQPQNPSGLFYSGWITFLFFLIGFLALVIWLARALPPPFNFVWEIPAPLVDVARPPTTTELFAVGIGAVVAAFVHMFFVNRNRKPLWRVRQDLEREWIEEWNWLVRCRQTEMVWKSANELCNVLLFGTQKAPDGAEGLLARGNDSSLGALFSLIDQLDSWLDQLRGEAQGRGDQARRRHPQTFATVGDLQNLPTLNLRPVWPTVSLQVPLIDFNGQRRPSNLILVPPDPKSLLSATAWQANRRGNAQGGDVAAARGLAFLTSIEDAIQEGIVEKNLLPGDLDQALSQDPHLGHETLLAARLDDLARAAITRGAPGQFDTAPQGYTTLIAVPSEEVAGRVNAAITLASNDPTTYNYLSQIVPSPSPAQQGYCMVTKHAGEAIVVLQFRHFVWDDEVGTHLEDVEIGRRYHYAEGIGVAGGDPAQHKSFNATNTEFYMLPELAAATQIEVAGGMTRSLSPLFVPRLYGSDIRVGDVPTVIDLYYYARAHGYLRQELSTPGMHAPGVGQLVTWYLLDDPSLDVEDALAEGRACPLVTYSNLPASNPGDPLGSGRFAIVLFDAFLAAMSAARHGLGADQAPRILVNNTQVRYQEWNGPAGDLLEAIRTELVQQWQFLAPGQVAGVYNLQWEQVQHDAAQFDTQHRDEWRYICGIVFSRGAQNRHAQWSPAPTRSYR